VLLKSYEFPCVSLTDKVSYANRGNPFTIAAAKFAKIICQLRLNWYTITTQKVKSVQVKCLSLISVGTTGFEPLHAF